MPFHSLSLTGNHRQDASFIVWRFFNIHSTKSSLIEVTVYLQSGQSDQLGQTEYISIELSDWNYDVFDELVWDL